MCFSVEADLVAGVVVGAIAVDSLRHVHHRAQRAVVALPVIFAVHQLIEAGVWWGLGQRPPDTVWQPAAWVYLAIAFGLLPVIVPIAVGALEPISSRQRIRPFTAIGAAVSLTLLYAVVRGPVEASIDGRRIAYQVDLWQGGFIVALYVLATCGSLLASSHRHIRAFGVVNLGIVVLLAWADRTGFISLWCLWAAVTSVAIDLHLRYDDRLSRAELTVLPA